MPTALGHCTVAFPLEVDATTFVMTTGPSTCTMLVARSSPGSGGSAWVAEICATLVSHSVAAGVPTHTDNSACAPAPSAPTVQTPEAAWYAAPRLLLR